MSRSPRQTSQQLINLGAPFATLTLKALGFRVQGLAEPQHQIIGRKLAADVTKRLTCQSLDQIAMDSTFGVSFGYNQTESGSTMRYA